MGCETQEGCLKIVVRASQGLFSACSNGLEEKWSEKHSAKTVERSRLRYTGRYCRSHNSPRGDKAPDTTMRNCHPPTARSWASGKTFATYYVAEFWLKSLSDCISKASLVCWHKGKRHSAGGQRSRKNFRLDFEQEFKGQNKLKNNVHQESKPASRHFLEQLLLLLGQDPARTSRGSCWNPPLCVTRVACETSSQSHESSGWGEPDAQAPAGRCSSGAVFGPEQTTLRIPA